MAGLPDTFPPFVKKGGVKSEYSIIVAGKELRLRLVARTCAHCPGRRGREGRAGRGRTRGFFSRNAVAHRRVVIRSSRASACVVCSKRATKRRSTWRPHSVKHLGTGKTFVFPAPGAVAPVIEAGGIFAYARAQGMIKTK